MYDTNIPVSSNGVFGTPDDNFNNTYQNNNATRSTGTVDDNADGETRKQDGSEDDIRFYDYSFCGNCGIKLNKDVKFCPNCGKEKR